MKLGSARTLSEERGALRRPSRPPPREGRAGEVVAAEAYGDEAVVMRAVAGFMP